MRAISFPAGAAAEVVHAPRPAPGPGRLLVRTEAAGAGVGLLRALAAAAGRGEPARPGAEIVGTVAAVGPGTTRFGVGDRVGGVVFEDAYAELIPADPALLTPVPAGVDAGAALAVVRGGLVALGALRAGTFASGESVLVTAAAGGTGHLAVQLSRALGAARVVAAVGSAGKAGFARECGADEVVTYDQPSWGDPVDLVLDGAGGDLLRRGVDALAPFGRLVALSAAGGTVEAGTLLGGMRSVVGFAVGTLNRARPEVVERHRAELWKLLADGRIRPRHADFPLAEIGAALELLANRGNLGRVTLRADG